MSFLVNEGKKTAQIIVAGSFPFHSGIVGVTGAPPKECEEWKNGGADVATNVDFTTNPDSVGVLAGKKL